MTKLYIKKETLEEIMHFQMLRFKNKITLKHIYCTKYICNIHLMFPTTVTWVILH